MSSCGKSGKILWVPVVGRQKRENFKKLQKQLGDDIEKAESDTTINLSDVARTYKQLFGAADRDEDKNPPPTFSRHGNERKPAGPPMDWEEFDSTCGKEAMDSHFVEEEDLDEMLENFTLDVTVNLLMLSKSSLANTFLRMRWKYSPIYLVGFEQSATALDKPCLSNKPQKLNALSKRWNSFLRASAPSEKSSGISVRTIMKVTWST